jgi:NhaA family Na+:H+ antiporter
LAIGAGLVLGKLIGVFGAIWLAESLGIARRPDGVSWLQAWARGILPALALP